MREEIYIDIRKLIIHILDTNLQMPVLSGKEAALEDDVVQFVGNHIGKILCDDGLKTAEFGNEESAVRNLCIRIHEDEGCYVEATSQAASMLYDIMLQYPSIPSGDLVCCLFSVDNQDYLGLMKFNYKTSFIHFVDSEGGSSVNSIIKQKNALPGENQKVDECIMVNLDTMEIKVLEKKYEINGENQFYLSTMFLDTVCKPSKKEKARVFKKATESFSKRVLADETRITQNLKTAISEQLEESPVIELEKVAESAFGNNSDLKRSYIEHMEEAGFTDDVVEIDEATAKKAFKKQKIKTDSGIEITLPYELYKEKGKVEFINNTDGTISIMIRNIGKITSM